MMRLVRRLVRPYVSAETKYNSAYSEEEYFYELLFSALKQYSAEGSSKVLNLSFRVPSPDQMLRIFRYSTSMLAGMRGCMLDGTLGAAKRFGAFRQPTDIAIDFFDIPYYGDIGSMNVVGTKHKAGTNYAHSFLCADAVIKGERFCLDFLSRTMLAKDAELVKELLKTALERVSVRLALLDREFFQVGVVRLLRSSSLHFIIPATDTEEIKRLKKEYRHKLPCVVDYTMRSKDGEVTVKLALLEQEKDGKKVIYGFITNLAWQPHEIAEYYRNRWGTETNNRKRNEFRAVTTSRSYELRYLYYMLSVAMHNIWILANLMIGYEVYGMQTLPLVETYLTKELLVAEIVGA
jgi:hypothetical protein